MKNEIFINPKSEIEARDVEKFATNTTPEKLSELEKRVGKINRIIEKIKSNF